MKSMPNSLKQPQTREGHQSVSVNNSPDLSLINGQYCFIDFITSGSDPNNDQILEISALKCTNQKPVDSYFALGKTTKVIDHNLQRDSGLSVIRLWREGKDIDLILSELKQFVGDCPLIIPYSNDQIKSYMTNSKIDFINNLRIDLIQLSKSIYHDQTDHSLADICKRLNIFYKINNYDQTKQKVMIMSNVFYKLLFNYPNLLNPMINKQLKHTVSESDQLDNTQYISEIEKEKTQWIEQYQNDVLNQFSKPVDKKVKKVVEKQPEQTSPSPSSQPVDVNQEDLNVLKDKLEKEIIDLQNKLDEQKVSFEQKLKKQETKFNELYLSKIKQKAAQADELVRVKTAEIESKFQAKLEHYYKYGFEKAGSELVDLVNRFEQVVSSEPTDPVLKSYFQGFLMFKELFNQFLNRMNITKTIVSVGDTFDPHIMEGLETIPVSELDKDNKVLKVINPCYQLHDRVIKYALVEVGKYHNPDNQSNSVDSLTSSNQAQENKEEE